MATRPKIVQTNAIADAELSRLRRALDEALSGSPPRGLRAAVAARDVARVDAILRDAWRRAEPLVQQAIRDSTRRVAAQAAHAASAAPLRAVWRYDAVNTWAVAWAEQYSANLVTAITAEQFAAIRAATVRVMRGEWSAATASRHLSRVIGMNRQQERRLAALADKGVSARALDRARARLIRERADMIARTETITAANKGQLRAWNEAQKRGLLPLNAIKRWTVTSDDRLCPICAPMHGEEVPLDGTFSGGVDAPPRHPRCRCALVTRPGKPGSPMPAIPPDTPEGDVLPLPVGDDTIPSAKPRLSAKAALDRRRKVMSSLDGQLMRNDRFLWKGASANGYVTGAANASVADARISLKKWNRPKRQALLKSLQAEQPIDVGVLFVGEASALKATHRKYVTKVIADVSRLIDKRALGTPDKVWVTVHVDKRGRAYALGTEIHISPVESPATIAHEFMHVIEDVSRTRGGTLHTRVQAYLDDRLARRGKGEQRLRDITGLNYGADEIADPDDFANPYYGKAYRVQTGPQRGQRFATEVSSMAIEDIVGATGHTDDDELFEAVLRAWRWEE